VVIGARSLLSLRRLKAADRKSDESMNRDTDVLDSVFVPDFLTPTQYFDSKRRDSGDDPLKRLMMAVLLDAIRCYQDGEKSGSALKRKKFVEVKDWIFDEFSRGPFSFIVVCEVLGLVPEYLRFGLEHWQTRGKLRLERRSPVLSSAAKISLTGNRGRSKKARVDRAVPIHDEAGNNSGGRRPNEPAPMSTEELTAKAGYESCGGGLQRRRVG